MCFQTTLQCSIIQARANGQISDDEYLHASDAIDNNPDFLAAAEKHVRRFGTHLGVAVPDCCEPALLKAGAVGAPNWANLIALFQTLLPLILQLVALFNPPKPPVPVPVPTP